MSENIETILRDECGLVKDRPIIVGVSGGPDSLCLMETLRQAGYSIIVAHFDHQLRPESSQDARMVEKTAARLMLGCIIDGADVRAYAEQEKLSLEEAARNLRYQFYVQSCAASEMPRLWQSVILPMIRWKPFSCTFCAAAPSLG